MDSRACEDVSEYHLLSTEPCPSTRKRFKMKLAIIFCVLLGITLNFPNEVTALPQENPLVGVAYGAECQCEDGTSCGGACNCNCSSGSCSSDGGETEVPDEGVKIVDEDGKPWSHCDCAGNTCNGRESCHCDHETGDCVAVGC